MSTITRPPRKSEETLTQFAEHLWERRRKEFQREIHEGAISVSKGPKTPKAAKAVRKTPK